jgi:lauroyl/myristoyl acyltransferase
MISYALYAAGAALVRVMPRRFAKGVAAAIAFSFFITRPGVRRNVRRNFAALGLQPKSIFPVFHNFSHAVTDFLRLSCMSREQMKAMCTLTGREHLEAATEGGRGVVLFAPHLGPWEIAGAYLTTIGYPLNTVALEHPSRRVTRFFSGLRRAWGLIDYPLHSCAGELVRALERGESVVLLIDRNFSRRGKQLAFLGTKAVLPVGHVVLALRTGAPLVPCSCFYRPDGTIEIAIGEPIPGAENPSTTEVACACLARVEPFIRAHPEQWFAFDNLWGEGSDA